MSTSTLDINTLAFPAVIDQGAIANSFETFSLDNVAAYCEMLHSAVKKSVDALIEASNYAVLIRRMVDIAPTDENSSERRDLKKQRREMEEAYGWKPSLINSYANIGEQLPENIANLRLLDFDTVKSLSRKKFQPILERFQDECLTIVEVRKEMAKINKALKKPCKLPKVLEWEQGKWGDDSDRRLVIRLEDVDTGTEFQNQYEQSGEVTVAAFIKHLLQRPTVNEQVLAVVQQPVEILVSDKELTFFDAPIFSDEAEIKLQNKLIDRYQKIDGEINRLIKEGYDESSYPLSNARSQLNEIILKLRQIGIEAELAESTPHTPPKT